MLIIFTSRTLFRQRIRYFVLSVTAVPLSRRLSLHAIFPHYLPAWLERYCQFNDYYAYRAESARIIVYVYSAIIYSTTPRNRFKCKVARAGDVIKVASDQYIRSPSLPLPLFLFPLSVPSTTYTVIIVTACDDNSSRVRRLPVSFIPGNRSSKIN